MKTLKIASIMVMMAWGLTVARADTTWTNLSGGTWSAAGNWDNGMPSTNVATAADAFLTNASASYTVNYDLASSAITNLMVKNGGANLTTLVMSSNTTLNGVSSPSLVGGTFTYADNVRLDIQAGATNSAYNQYFNPVSVSTPAVGLVESGGVLRWGGSGGNNGGLTISSSTLTNRGALYGYWNGFQNLVVSYLYGTSPTLVLDGGRMWNPGLLSIFAFNGSTANLTVTNGGSLVLSPADMAGGNLANYIAIASNRGLY